MRFAEPCPRTYKDSIASAQAKMVLGLRSTADISDFWIVRIPPRRDRSMARLAPRLPDLLGC